MHIRRDVITKQQDTTSAPFDLNIDTEDKTPVFTNTTPPIEIDTETEFVGQSSPLVIEWLVSEVKKLR